MAASKRPWFCESAMRTGRRARVRRFAWALLEDSKHERGFTTGRPPLGSTRFSLASSIAVRVIRTCTFNNPLRERSDPLFSRLPRDKIVMILVNVLKAFNTSLPPTSPTPSLYPSLKAFNTLLPFQPPLPPLKALNTSPYPYSPVEGL